MVKKLKISFITGLLPSGHYSQYITSGLVKTKKVNLLVYTDHNKENLSVKGSGKIIRVWSKSSFFVWEILKRIKKDKPDIVHFQHELNMYGSFLTAILFPVLLLLVKLNRYKIVTTIHAAPPQRIIDKKFVTTFNQNPKILKPWILKIVFKIIYYPIGLFSNKVFVHTNILKEDLVRDYGFFSKKIITIPASIPQKKSATDRVQKYFFYFGYISRRKGLDLAIRGFEKFLTKNPNSGYKLVLAGGTIKGQEASLQEILNVIDKSRFKKQIVYKGFIEESEQDDLYRKAYAVIIPAILSISTSGPLYHSSSYGKCTLVSKIGHLIEDVKDGETGILVDNHKWSEAFEFVVKNPNTVKNIERCTIKKAKMRSPLKTASKYLTIYNSLLS